MTHPEWYADAKPEPESQDDSIIIDGVRYVPISLSFHIAQYMKSGKQRKRFTAHDYDNAMLYIRLALEDTGPIVDFSGHKYADKLYPKDAATVLALSRTRYWPEGHDTDGVLETMLMKWMIATIGDYTIFTRRLFEAIHELNCAEGVFHRLNFDSIAQPVITRVSIATKFGAVTNEVEPRRQVLLGEARERVKKFLQDHGKFTPDINMVYEGLSRVYQTYSLEQSLLSWMGYLVIRAIAEGADLRMKVSGRQLLMIPAPSVNILPPSPTPQKLEE